MKNGLAPVTDRYDYIIMDTPANDKLAYRLSMSLDNVYLLVPMLGSRVSYDALTPIFEAFDEIRRTINPSLQFAGIFMNQADTRLNAYKYIAETLNEQMSAVGAKLFESTVRLAKGPIENAGLNRLPVVAAAPYCNVSLDFVNLAKELKQRIAEMEAKG